MKRQIIYEVALTGSGQNFYTLYRHVSSELAFISHFVQNLSIDFAEAVTKARAIAGPDENEVDYEKRLLTDENEVSQIVRLGRRKEQAEMDGIFTFGKHKGENIAQVFIDDHKYVEWVAKGGFIYDKQNDFWNETIVLDRPLRQHAIALLIGAGEWIERQGKFMAVEKAKNLDWLDSLTVNPNIVDGKRVKKMTVKILKVYYNNNEFGGKFSFKFVDEHDHVYHGSSTSGEINREHEDMWCVIDFTPSTYQGKVYAKRIKVQASAIDIKAGHEQLDREIYSKFGQGCMLSPTADVLADPKS
jgi:exodeoxyribonuclease X-like protein